MRPRAGLVLLLCAALTGERSIDAFSHLPALLRHAALPGAPRGENVPKGAASRRRGTVACSAPRGDADGEGRARGRPLGGGGEGGGAQGGGGARLGRRGFAILAAGLAGGVLTGEAKVDEEFRQQRDTQLLKNKLQKDFDLQRGVDPELIREGKVLSELQAREACSDSWSPDWRRTGKGGVCLEPDGCLWRKIDESVKYPGGIKGFMKAENTFSMPFIAYLSRFILNFDPRWSGWWLIRQSALPPSLGEEAVASLLEQDFSAFMASVEYGLSQYTGREGVELLAQELEAAYGGLGPPARRQLGFLFAMQDGGSTFHQPSAAVARLLGDDVGGLGPAERSQWQAVIDSLRDADFSRAEMPLLLPPRMPLVREPEGRFVLPGEMAVEDFGVRGYAPVKRERRVTGVVYVAFALAGLVGCAGTHTVVVPLDVVKTREQTDPGRYGSSLTQGIATIWREEGLQGLTSGLGPTLAGYSWYGLTVYPGYELLKRFFVSAVGEQFDSVYHVYLVLLSGACSTAVACLGVCPAETTRIRQVATPGYAPTALGVTQRILREEGLMHGLYEGFSLLLTRQVLFGMMKFLVFDYFASAVYTAFPVMDDNDSLQLAVSLLSGAVAGVVSSVVSQPADTVLTKMKESTSVDAATVIARIYETYGVGGFFLGLQSRCVWAGSIIAGQFLFYDLCKNLLQVTSEDLTLFLDVLGSIKLAAPDL